MKLKRLTAMILALGLVLCLLPATTLAADTETVDYQYTGQYVHNWGTRQETATFLSPMAEDFYEDNNVTYSDLAGLSGSTALSGVTASELYGALYELMDSNQTTMTSYGEVRYLSCYTDCEQNDKSQIVLFYKGTKISAKWDYGKTWQREHTWPNSKSTGGSNKISNSLRNRETDIMLLRPADPSNNMSRSNTAYGESYGYFNPNKFAVSGHDVRGDVARTILYVYVRWGGDSTYHDGAQNYLWGKSGVMENKTVLLKWMAEDPVDTWEMGRNDSVESITGTRNVFIDYPELAFALFNEQIPEDMATPSGGAVEQGCAHENSFAIKAVAATCQLSGNTAGRYCNDCHSYYDGYTVLKELGHNWQITACVAPKICTRCGKTEDIPAGHTYDDGVDGSCNVCGLNRETVETREVVHMFRMYNPNTGEHFYTGSTVERDNLIAAGWQYEGIGFTFPANTGDPVHRLFQPSTGEHLYTMDVAEKDRLMAEGWNYEGIAFNSAYDTEAVQHRLHNPNATVGAYHFTFSEEEMNNLIAAGWEYQGIGWYSCWK